MSFRRYGSLAAAAFAAIALATPAFASSYKVIWTPQMATGGDPDGHLLRQSNGALVGTSYGYPGHGVVFQLIPSRGSWTPKKIFAFSGVNGSNPAAGIARDSQGSLYGTTYNGGKHGYGTAFRLTLAGGVWKELVLHSFKGGGSDGANPSCDLAIASSTTLYGTTQYGGSSGNGTAFSLTYSGGVWSEHILYSFGGQPLSGVYMDSSGALYGTEFNDGGYGSGVVYKLAQSGSTWNETLLHSFGGSGDGSNPIGPLIADGNGTLYGTTSGGGRYSAGTVFKMTYNGSYWAETVLWSFGANGENYPIGSLYVDSTGSLYGTTDGGSGGYGSIFKLTQSGGSWSETVLHSFAGGSDGANPFAGVVPDSVGNLYGTTTLGGTYGYGTAFEISP